MMGCDVTFSDGWDIFFNAWEENVHKRKRIIKQFLKRSPLLLETFVFSLSALKVVNGCLPKRITTQYNVRLSLIKQSLSSDYFGCMNGLNGCRRGEKGTISFRKRTLFCKGSDYSNGPYPMLVFFAAQLMHINLITVQRLRL